MIHPVFDAHAAQYDAWYDSEAGRSIFAMEVDCLRPPLQRQSPPYLEIGVGTGRFARALGVDYGIDPATNLLKRAKARGIRVIKAEGEALPFPADIFGGVLIALTLCFVRDPQRVLKESWRVLRPGGGLVLGLILRDSPWAEFYTGKGKEGHPLYRRARFFSKQEIEGLLHQSGFEGRHCCSILFQPPGREVYHYESPLEGCLPSAGFVALAATKATEPGL